ncbi:MAG: threonine--tRNA ligase [Nitrospiraceae bacterium]|nr:threonine--tRNA ligase [Nitrospiraceae bacterium]
MNNLEIKRHSLAHVLAAAVLEMFPEAKFGVGPNIANGFYYDFDLPRTLIPEDLPILEKKMKKIIKQNLPFDKKVIDHKKAVELFKKAKQDYKVEILGDEAKEKEVSLYKIGNFVDLCKGPHLDSAGEIDIKSFKLTKIAGAYWRGDEKNKMLQRIYGIAFDNKKKLNEYLEMVKEAEKRDHRKLGQELELFIFDEEVGAGLPLWLPKGALLKQIIMDFALNTYLKNGYELVSTPHIASSKLWSHSGHLDFYGENMYNSFGIEDEEYLLKPMNCPFHVKIYKHKKRSYRELPFRWTEMGTVYRYERSGTLHGLTRVRGFTQDDAHIICAPEQLYGELEKALDLTFYMLNTFGFSEFEINLSTRDPKNKNKFIGNDKSWEKAETELKKVIEKSGRQFTYDIGGAVFYGPKIDIKVSDTLGRKWQLSTIQFDFNLPSRFEMSYIGEDGKEHTPFMIHRALLGSLERFIGVLIEHYAGAFPLWLSPVQVKILPVSSEKHSDYAQKINSLLLKNNIRVEIDDSNETIGKKVREAEKQKIPYMLVVGDKESENNSVAVRTRGFRKIESLEIGKFIERVGRKAEEKK